MAKWTQAQKKVIEARDRNILVSAAAGSGKTAVLVERIIQRILDPIHPIDVDKLLVVTFTNAAASEMRERVLRAIEKELEKNPLDEHLQKQQAFVHNAKITTIHSFCLEVIHEHFANVDLDPCVRVADEGEIALLKSDVVKEVIEDFYAKKDPAFYQFVSQFESKNSDAYLEEMILNLYQKAMGYPWPKDWLDCCFQRYQLNSKEAIEDSIFCQVLNIYANGLLSEAMNQCDLMIDICKNGGPEVYTETIERDRQSIEAIFLEQSFNRRRTKLNFAFENLPRCKNDSCDPDLKQLVMDARKGVKDSIKKIKEKLYFQSLEQTVVEIEKCRPIIEVYVEITKAFIDQFKKKKQDKNIIDFNDFEQYAIQILVKNENGKAVPTAVAKNLAENFEEVMIDEYQDSNLIQETILASVSKENTGIYNRFMVGDVKQSIYGFRGAKPDIFIDKYNTYTTDSTDLSGYKIILDRNFRSTPGVINSTNFFFRQIMNHELGGIDYDEENKLYCGLSFGEPTEEESKRVDDQTELILIHSNEKTDTANECEDSEEDLSGSSQELEAKVIANKIRQLVDEKKGLLIFDQEKKEYRSIKYRDIVILLRNMSGLAQVINDELIKQGIPAYMESKSGYFNSYEIRTIISYLKIIDNPVQDLPLASVLKSPIVGITDEQLAIIRAIGGKEESLYQNILTYLSYDLENEWEIPELSYDTELQKSLVAFMNQLNGFRKKTTYLSIYELISEVLEQTGYLDYVKAMPSGIRRSANVLMLKEKAAAYENGSYKGLFNFVRYIEKINKYEIDMGEASVLSESDDTVRIMTIHKSKGLEFPVVFVANMGKKFNFMDARTKSVIHSDLGIGMDFIDTETRIKSKNLIKTAINKRIELDTIEEEMRLFYVACTRARTKLILTANNIDEKILDKMVSQRKNNNQYLGYGIITQCTSFLDFIGAGLGRNKAFQSIYQDVLPYEIPKDNSQYFQESNVKVSYLSITDVFADVIKNKMQEQMNLESLDNFDKEMVYSESIHKMLEESMNYQYPFEKEVHSHAKMSVSEIKKISFDTEQENESAKLFEPMDESKTKLIHGLDTQPTDENQTTNITKPQQTKESRPLITGEHTLTSAEIGTAYHKVFELFDFTIELSANNITKMLDGFVETGKLTRDARIVIKEEDIFKFALSPIGQRMKKAFLQGNLHREAQFVLGLYETEIEEFQRIARIAGSEKKLFPPENVSQVGDIVLVQGIVDAYFIENDKIVIVDYKTDHVKTMKALADHYFVQLELYKRAIQQITHIPVKENILYSVRKADEICTWKLNEQE